MKEHLSCSNTLSSIMMSHENRIHCIPVILRHTNSTGTVLAISEDITPFYAGRLSGVDRPRIVLNTIWTDSIISISVHVSDCTNWKLLMQGVVIPYIPVTWHRRDSYVNILSGCTYSGNTWLIEHAVQFVCYIANIFTRLLAYCTVYCLNFTTQ